MNRPLLTLLAIAVLAGLTGCCSPRNQRMVNWPPGSCTDGPEDCASSTSGYDTCGEVDYEGGYDPDAGLSGLLGGIACRRRCRQALTPGPPTGAITYPYYTNRGPRDFLAQAPRSIGP